MTAHPVDVNGRISIVYRLDSFEHKSSFYCDVESFVDECTINGFGSTVAISLQDLANAICGYMRPLFTDSTKFIRADLSEYVVIDSETSVWEVRNSVALFVDGSGTGADVYASQLTYVFRDQQGHGVRFTLLEGIFAVLGQVGYAGLTGPQQDFVDGMLGTGATDPQPFDYVASREGFKLQALSDGNYSQNNAIARRRSR